MRLYASDKKEAPVLQAALAKYIVDGLDKDGKAQELLTRIATCLELQNIQNKEQNAVKYGE